MKSTKVVAAVVVVVIVVAVVVALVVHGKSNSNDMSSMNMSGNSSSGGSQSSGSNSQPTATNSVTIENFAFAPASVTVKTGTTVTWTNKDSVAHTVTADISSSDAPDSGNIAPGKSYGFTFKTAGTYKYHCAIHPSMLGTVTVTQ